MEGFTNLALVLLLPGSLADSAKSLTIKQGYFPGVLSYKDSTISSCYSHSSVSKWNPFARCYAHWSYRAIIKRKLCPCLFKLDNDADSEWAVLEYSLCFHRHVGAALLVAVKTRESARQPWLNEYEYALRMTGMASVYWKLQYSEKNPTFRTMLLFREPSSVHCKCHRHRFALAALNCWAPFLQGSLLHIGKHNM